MINNILAMIIDKSFTGVSFYILFNLILNPLVVILVSTYFMNKEGISLMKAFLISSTISLLVIVGSRLIHAIIAIGYYKDFGINPLELGPRNFTMFGGFVLVVPMLYVICRIMNLKFWSIADLFTPGWALGIVFNKTGCLLNGCCFGVPTTLPFGISYPKGTEPYGYYYNELISLVGENGNLMNSISIHPVQTYEALIGLLGFTLSIYLLRRKQKNGIIFLTFALYYSLARVILHYLRATPYNMMEVKELLPFLYGGIFIATLFIFIYRIKKIQT